MEIYNELRAMSKIFKDFLNVYNSRSLSRALGMGHSGVFKIMKRLEKKGRVIPKRIGKAVVYSINAENPLAIKELEFALLFEAQQYPRWLEELRALEFEAKFVILFGSITRNEKEARDIDLLIVASSKDFSRIKRFAAGKNKVMTKRLHLILQNEEEFLNDVRKKNKAMIEIIKNGIVLFGQGEFIKLLNER